MLFRLKKDFLRQNVRGLLETCQRVYQATFRKKSDAVVKIKFKRRAYKGKQKQDEVNVRLVAIYNIEEKRYHIHITNIHKNVLDVKDIATLYGARRDIELLFKELKKQIRA